MSGKQHQRAVKLQTVRGSAVPDCETVLVGADQSKLLAALVIGLQPELTLFTRTFSIAENWISSSHVDLEDCIEEVSYLNKGILHWSCGDVYHFRS